MKTYIQYSQLTIPALRIILTVKGAAYTEAKLAIDALNLF